MKNYEEIKDIITNRYGITSVEKYKEWLVTWKAAGGTATEEEAALLSPDNINCRDFWRVCHDLFGTDPICNSAEGAVYKNNIEANRINFRLAASTGITTVIDMFRNHYMRVLEYGAGLGCIKNHIEVNTVFDYCGFDVNPRIPDILSTTEKGYLPSDFVEDNTNKFGAIISSNVIQHISQSQRQKLFEDANKLLIRTGYLMFNLVTFPQTSLPIRYMALYGQFILIPEPKQIYEELSKNGFIAVSTTHQQSITGFVCQKI